MSCVYLLTADKPLPLCDKQEERTSSVTMDGKMFTISFVRGFRIQPHTYYRSAVDRLGLELKPWQYELDLELHEKDLSDLRSYLAEHLSPGSIVELWNLWVGIDRFHPPSQYRIALADLHMDILGHFLNPPHPEGSVGQCRLTVII